MRALSIRPESLPYKNGVYFPDGIPGSNDHSPTNTMVRYFDQKGKEYWICYTEKQVIDQVKKKGFFSPYIPFMITPDPL